MEMDFSNCSRKKAQRKAAVWRRPCTRSRWYHSQSTFNLYASKCGMQTMQQDVTSFRNYVHGLMCCCRRALSMDIFQNPPNVYCSRNQSELRMRKDIQR